MKVHIQPSDTGSHGYNISGIEVGELEEERTGLKRDRWLRDGVMWYKLSVLGERKEKLTNRVIEVIRTRRSVRGYQPGPVTREQIETVVDCGRLAPSAFNEQSWEFVVVENPAVLKDIAELAPDNCPFLPDASACIVVCGLRSNGSLYLDGAAAVENMLLAAHALGLGACWVQAKDKPYAGAIMQLLGIPAEQALVAMVSIGVPFGEVNVPKKRSLKDVLHWEKF